jgi:hypothetical protein
MLGNSISGNLEVFELGNNAWPTQEIAPAPPGLEELMRMDVRANHADHETSCAVTVLTRILAKEQAGNPGEQSIYHPHAVVHTFK